MNLTAQQMLQALKALDHYLSRPVQLIVGGGGAMILAHHLSLATSDIDAIPSAGVTSDELDPLVKRVAEDMSIPPDWLNPYYATFTHVLPSDYGSRLEQVGIWKNLEVLALSAEDLLIMKCFAGRLKDRAHARALIRKGARINFVESHLEALKKKNIPKADAALDFLDEVTASEEG